MQPQELIAVPLFAGLDSRERVVVGRYADEVDVPAGRVLARDGRGAYAFFAVEDGMAEVVREGEVVGTLGPGDVFGECGGEPTVTATSPMSLVVLGDAQLRAIERRMPGVGERIRAALAELA
jgi:CRP/FNR family transcriptional regulator, cyclic AMP receptor protein